MIWRNISYILIVDNTKITISDSIIGIYELANENG